MKTYRILRTLRHIRMNVSSLEAIPRLKEEIWKDVNLLIDEIEAIEDEEHTMSIRQATPIELDKEIRHESD